MKAQLAYALSLDQISAMIKANGHKRTVVVQGHMGTGKSSMLWSLAKELPKHLPCYFDCTTKDLGDITIPNIAKLDTGAGFVQYLTNEELGVHNDVPIILNVDEIGKANRAVQNALLRLLLERKIGGYTLHPDSIIFATTNLGAENVGDLLQPHARNRLTVVTARKPSNLEFIDYGLNNDFDHIMLGWCKDNPQIFQTFETVKNPDENPYIYHPQSQRTAFVTPRSLEAASDWLKQRDQLDDQTLTAALMGTVGDRAAMDLMAFTKMADQLPTLDSIKTSPETAKVPTSAAAVCMVVYRTLASIEKDWISAWVKYMDRLDKEAQGMFANGVRAPKYSKQSVVMTNKDFTKWAMNNGHMFSAEKR